MDAYRLAVKLYLEPETSPDLALFIPIFHRWIRESVLDELLIDVADYSHVPNGPGVMLIAHGANYALDAADGRLGLLYARKRPEAGDFAHRLRSSLQRARRAASKLEQEEVFEGRLRIPGDRWALRIQDRLLAANDDRTFAAVEPELRGLFAGAETEVRLRREPDPGCFGVQVEADPGLLTP